jgi:hypothetical protein
MRRRPWLRSLLLVCVASMLFSYRRLHRDILCYLQMEYPVHSVKTIKVKVKVTLRPTVNMPFCPGVRHPSGTSDQFYFLLKIFFRQLRVCYFVAPTLTRGRVCNLLVQLLLGLARAVTLLSKSRRTHAIFYCLI